MTCTAPVIALIAIAATLAWLLRFGKRESYLPPGPPTLPLIGNIHVLPTKFPHYQFTEWARQYGGIYSLKIGTQTAIVLNSMEHVKELLDKRNATTASRPRNYAADMVTKGLYFALIPANRVWRIQRKAAGTFLLPSAIPAHLPLQYAEASQTLYDILHSPEDLCDHLSRYSFSIIASIVYGKRCPRTRTRELVAFYNFQFIWTELLSPGTVPPVDKFPILGYIPERWAPWKTLLKKVQQGHRELYFGLLEESERRLESGQGSNGSFAEELLGRMEEYAGMDREMIGYFGGVLIEGGAETTPSLLKSFVLFLIASPEIQRKAYEEVMRVVGIQRTPVLEDYKDLPYLDAVLKEVQRLRPVAPLAVPHETTATEQYLDYIIPENTILFPNIYGINHDPEYFKDPESFWPERYLLTEHGTKPGVDDSCFRADIIFGFGRRICPGIHLGKNSLALAAMNLIWAFEFKPLLDPETGNDAPIDLFAYEEGVIFSPKSFQCRINPRSKSAVDIIEHQYREATETLVKYERDIAPEDKEWLQESRKNR
ncbi:hypothetical protein VNI00_010020 [Paramarasmius palmivorus]|uniref:Cytochrome P450 n=1 Tax=Paramarasmius palmivorus TaxID=297713 RepID=A0AAW0CME3_9AGAR